MIAHTVKQTTTTKTKQKQKTTTKNFEYTSQDYGIYIKIFRINIKIIEYISKFVLNKQQDFENTRF